MSVLRKIMNREVWNGQNISFRRTEQVTPTLINRLGLEQELEGHSGCVNCLEWDQSGRLLASGSDDLHVILWDPFRHKIVSKVRTGHQGNIFSVKFLPHSNDQLLVTGAADCRINVHDLNRKEITHVFRYHLGRVKRIATAPNIPCIFWSAAEDGTIMQFDLRCTSTTTEAPNNILINLSAHLGQFAEAKCLAINPLRPEYLAVGANDAYVRLYDRRMLSCSTMRSPPENPNRYPWDHPHLEDIEGENYDMPQGCAQYFIAGHLPKKQQDYRKRYRSLNSTYLTFGPDGTELLVNLGGEQIYLFDINKKTKPIGFDVNVLGPNRVSKEEYSSNGYSVHRNGMSKSTCSVSQKTSSSSSTCPQSSSSLSDNTVLDKLSEPHKNLSTYKRHKGESKAMNPIVESLKKAANTLFEQGHYKAAIDMYSQAIARCNSAAVLYGNRAAAYLKRKWDGDIYAALRDCSTALSIDPYHMKAHFRLSRCLHDLYCSEKAYESLVIFKTRFPDYASSHSCVSLEKEIRAAIFSQSEINNGGSDDGVRNGPPRFESASEKQFQLDANDYKSRFCGHCNTTTDIKEANFFGSNGQFIVAGSDDGSFFIWDRHTTNIVRVLRGDESIVNCLQPHPSCCLLATSGIDPVVRLWSPRPEDGTENDRSVDNKDDAALANQKRMNADPLEAMLMNMGYRITGFLDEEDGGQDGGPANCRTT